MPIFKRIALVALVALSKTSHGAQLRRGQKYRHLETDNTVTGFATPLDVSASKSSKEERMSSLTELSSQFDRVTNFISDPSSDLSEDRLKAIVSKMGEFEGAFQQFVSDMTKDEADGEEWEKFDDARRAYREVIGAIVKRGAEFVDDSVSASNDVSTIVDEDRMNTLEQLDTSFVFMENTIGDAPMNPEGKKLLESFAGTLPVISESFEKMKDDMEEKKASKQEWDEFGTVVKDFGSLTVVLNSKLAAMTEQVEASVAYSDVEEGGGEAVPGADMKDGSEEKLAVLTATNRAFDDLEQFLNGMEMNESNTERLQNVVSTMGQIPSQFAAMYDNFEETGADEEQMKMFKKTLERFSAISDKVTERLEESAAFAETEAVPSTTENEQQKLVEILRLANGKIEGANSKDDLLEAGNAMEFVHKRVSEMENGKIKSGFVDVMTAFVSKFNEKLYSFEEGSDASVDESHENASPPEEMVDVEEVESFDVEEEVGNSVSDLEVLTAMLSDVKDSLISGLELGSLQNELMYVKSQLKGMEPSEVVTKMDETVALMDNTLYQELVALEQEEEEVESVEEEKEVISAKGVTKADDVVSVMSNLGFPEAKIEEVKSILNDELEAYDVNTEEKDEIKEDESEY